VTKQEKAVKIYDKTTIPNLGDYMKKVEILNSIDHPLVLNYEEIYEDKDYLYFVTDYMRGGELYDAMVSRGNYSEKDAAFIMKQLL
jgi:calcium-dependent protein kinase